MKISGEQSRELLREALAALADGIPAGVNIEVTGSGGWCVVSSSLDMDAAEIEAAFAANLPVLPASKDILRGVGTWIPFVPRKVAAKLAVIDAIERIQSIVSDLTRSPWPAADDASGRADIGRLSHLVEVNAGWLNVRDRHHRQLASTQPLLS